MKQKLDYICFVDVLIVVKIKSHTKNAEYDLQTIASFFRPFFYEQYFFSVEKKNHMIKQVDNIQM